MVLFAGLGQDPLPVLLGEDSYAVASELSLLDNNFEKKW